MKAVPVIRPTVGSIGTQPETEGNKCFGKDDQRGAIGVGEFLSELRDFGCGAIEGEGSDAGNAPGVGRDDGAIGAKGKSECSPTIIFRSRGGRGQGDEGGSEVFFGRGRVSGRGGEGGQRALGEVQEARHRGPVEKVGAAVGLQGAAAGLGEKEFRSIPRDVWAHRADDGKFLREFVEGLGGAADSSDDDRVDHDIGGG